MPPKRARIVGDNPLEARPQRVDRLPGEDVPPAAAAPGRPVPEHAQARDNGSSASTPATPAENPLLQGPKKLFAYKLPVALGTKFKLYCHARGRTAEGVLAELLAEFLKDKKIDPTETE